MSFCLSILLASFISLVLMRSEFMFSRKFLVEMVICEKKPPVNQLFIEVKIATIHVSTCWAFSGEHIVLFLLKACTCLSVPLLTKVRKRSTTCRAQKSPPPPAPEAAYKAGSGALPSFKINNLRFPFSISRSFYLKKTCPFCDFFFFWWLLSNFQPCPLYLSKLKKAVLQHW